MNINISKLAVLSSPPRLHASCNQAAARRQIASYATDHACLAPDVNTLGFILVLCIRLPKLPLVVQWQKIKTQIAQSSPAHSIFTSEKVAVLSCEND